MSFVFNDSLASFPLFFIFCSSRLSLLAGARRFWFAALRREGCGLRRIVPDLTTLLGYHGSGELSSENCGENCCGPDLGGTADFRPWSPDESGGYEPDGTRRRYARIRPALGEASPYMVCRYRRISVQWPVFPAKRCPMLSTATERA